MRDTDRLVTGALGGSPDEFDRLLARLRQRLVLWCAARMSAALRGHVEPEDAAQEILLALARDRASFRGGSPSEFYAWFWTIAEHRLSDMADHYAALKRQPVEPAAPMARTSPSQAAARAEMIDKLRDAISRLPEDQRAALRLVKLEQRPVEEVASMLGRTVNAVRILYCRALQGLAELLPPSA